MASAPSTHTHTHTRTHNATITQRQITGLLNSSIILQTGAAIMQSVSDRHTAWTPKESWLESRHGQEICLSFKSPKRLWVPLRIPFDGVIEISCLGIKRRGGETDNSPHPASSLKNEWIRTWYNGTLAACDADTWTLRTIDHKYHKVLKCGAGEGWRRSVGPMV